MHNPKHRKFFNFQIFQEAKVPIQGINPSSYHADFHHSGTGLYARCIFFRYFVEHWYQVFHYYFLQEYEDHHLLLCLGRWNFNL